MGLQVEKFRSFLDGAGFYYDEKRMKDGTTLFLTRQEINDGNLITVAFVIDNDEEECGIFFHGIAEIKNPSKRTEALNLINDLNNKCHFGKFYLTDDWYINVNHNIAIARDGVFSPRSAMDTTVNIFSTIKENYSKLIRLQW